MNNFNTLTRKKKKRKKERTNKRTKHLKKIKTCSEIIFSYVISSFSLKIPDLEFVYMTGHVCRIPEIDTKDSDFLTRSFTPVAQTVLLQPIK